MQIYSYCCIVLATCPRGALTALQAKIIAASETARFGQRQSKPGRQKDGDKEGKERERGREEIKR